MGYLIHEFRLVDMVTGEGINASGGKAIICTAGTPRKATIYDPDNSFVALSNPITPSRGRYRFATLDTVNSVDVYVQAPGGQFLVLAGVTPQGKNEYAVDLQRKSQVYVIPFSFNDDAGDATETDTGIDLPACLVMPWPAVKVTALDATEDIDVGLLSSESGGDADGFIDSVSLAAAVAAKGTLLAAGDTMGALLSVLDSANAGDDAPEPHVVTGAAAVSVTYTLSTGTDTGEGFIHLPVQLF